MQNVPEKAPVVYIQFESNLEQVLSGFDLGGLMILGRKKHLNRGIGNEKLKHF